MAIDMKSNGVVGCCYYVAREQRLFLFSESKLCDLEVIDACMSLGCLHLTSRCAH